MIPRNKLKSYTSYVNLWQLHQIMQVQAQTINAINKSLEKLIKNDDISVENASFRAISSIALIDRGSNMNADDVLYIVDAYMIIGPSRSPVGRGSIPGRRPTHFVHLISRDS